MTDAIANLNTPTVYAFTPIAAPAKVGRGHFVGNAHVYSKDVSGLSAIAFGLAQNVAKLLLKGTTALTNNIGAAAQVLALTSLAPIVPASLSGTNLFSLANFISAAAIVEQNLCDVVGQINTLLAIVPAFPALVNNLGTPSLTCAAMTQTFTAVAAQGAPAAAVNAWLAALQVQFAQIQYWVGKIVTATGGAPLTGTVFYPAPTIPAVLVGTTVPGQSSYPAPDSLNKTYSNVIAALAAIPNATYATGTGDAVTAAAAGTLFTGIATNVNALVIALNAAVSGSVVAAAVAV